MEDAFNFCQEMCTSKTNKKLENPVKKKNQ